MTNHNNQSFTTQNSVLVVMLRQGLIAGQPGSRLVALVVLLSHTTNLAGDGVYTYAYDATIRLASVNGGVV
jgi:hypothetical protein